MSIKINSEKLREIKIENKKSEHYNFILYYAKQMYRFANSTDRKNYWRVIYLYLKR